jgi:hypothetical protein
LGDEIASRNKHVQKEVSSHPGGGTADGEKGDHVLLARPFNINTSHIEEIVEKLSLAFNSVFNHV